MVLPDNYQPPRFPSLYDPSVDVTLRQTGVFVYQAEGKSHVPHPSVETPKVLSPPFPVYSMLASHIISFPLITITLDLLWISSPVGEHHLTARSNLAFHCLVDDHPNGRDLLLMFNDGIHNLSLITHYPPPKTLKLQPRSIHPILI